MKKAKKPVTIKPKNPPRKYKGKMPKTNKKQSPGRLRNKRDEKGDVIPGRLITLPALKKAIAGSGGILNRIAKRLSVTRGRVCKMLDKWPDAQVAMEQERETVLDLAEGTIHEMMMQRIDFREAAANARWYAEKRGEKRGYAPRKTVTIEGGDKPLRVQNETLLPLDKLDLPIEVKRQILDAMEAYENLQKEGAESGK